MTNLLIHVFVEHELEDEELEDEELEYEEEDEEEDGPLNIEYVEVMKPFLMQYNIKIVKFLIVP